MCVSLSHLLFPISLFVLGCTLFRFCVRSLHFVFHRFLYFSFFFFIRARLLFSYLPACVSSVWILSLQSNFKNPTIPLERQNYFASPVPLQNKILGIRGVKRKMRWLKTELSFYSSTALKMSYEERTEPRPDEQTHHKQTILTHKVNSDKCTVDLKQFWKTAGCCASKPKCLWSVYSVIWEAVEHLYRGIADSSRSTHRMLMLFRFTSVLSPLPNIQGQCCINHGFTTLLLRSHLPPNTHSQPPLCLSASLSHHRPHVLALSPPSRSTSLKSPVKHSL